MTSLAPAFFDDAEVAAAAAEAAGAGRTFATSRPLAPPPPGPPPAAAVAAAAAVLPDPTPGVRRERLVALGPVKTDLLEGLVRHRLLLASQAAEMYGGEGRRATRRTQDHLAFLEAKGWAQGVRLVCPGRPVAWFATPEGLAVVGPLGGGSHAGGNHKRAPDPVDPRTVLGRARDHLVAANDVGLAFLRAARARGDDFGPGDWSHEVHHPRPGGRGGYLRADLLVRYAVAEPDGGLSSLVCFVEVDMGTETYERVVGQLRDYAAFAARPGTVAGGGAVGAAGDGWKRSYAYFPRVVVVLAGKAPAALERRREALCGWCRADEALDGRGRVKVLVTTLPLLEAHGPFAPVF